jgi:hypothetical protein
VKPVARKRVLDVEILTQYKKLTTLRSEPASYFQPFGTVLRLASELQMAMRRCLMSFRVLQFPAEGTTRVLRMRVIPEHWSTPSGYSPEISFFQSWFEDDSRPDGQNEYKINWGAVSGLALSVVVSASFWAGVGLLIARLAQ